VIRQKGKRIVIAAAIVLCVIVFVSGNYGLYRLIQVNAEQNQLEADIERLKLEQRELEETRERLRTDLGYIEKIAREKYGMIREGERVFILMPEK